MVIDLRLLDIGTTRDISRVLKITNKGTDGDGIEERECLHFVADDSKVRVFEGGQ